MPTQGGRARTLVVVVAVAVVAVVAGTTAVVSHRVPPASAQVSCSVPGGPPASPAGVRHGFTPTTPVRLLDTRDGTGGAVGPVGAGCTVVVDLRDSPVPVSASAVALSVTATESAERGFVTAHPCGTGRPYASNLNLRIDDPTPNLVVVPLDATRQVCLSSSGVTHLVADLTGWFSETGGLVQPVGPTRILDTRTALRPDGGSGPLPAGTVLGLPVGDVGVVPPAASAAIVNITVDEPDAAGFVTAYPCGTTPPLASNVNHLAFDTRAAQAIVGLGAGGQLCLFTYATAHVIVDLVAWVQPRIDGPPTAPFASALTPVVSERLLDTRDGTGGPAAPIAGGEERVWDPWLSGRIPTGASAVVVNVTATEATAPGYVRLAPCEAGGDTSTVNLVPGVDASNLAVVPLGGDGRVCVSAYATTHVIVDLVGVLTLPTLVADLVTAPALDEALSLGPDSTIRCGAGPTNVSITVRPAPGVAASIATRTPEGALDPGPPPAYGTVGRAVVMQPDDAVIVSLFPRFGPDEERWIRCLPSDFPVYAVGARGEAEPGWYLTDTGVPFSPGTTVGQFAIIADEWGVPVWYRRLAVAAIDVHRQSDGRLIWGEFSSPGFGTDPNLGYVVSELDGTFVKRWRTVGAPTDYHGTVELANGNRILIAYKRRAGTVDLRSLGTDDQGRPLGAAEVVYDGVLQEVTPGGGVVWEWNSKDHVALEEVTLPTRFAFVQGAVDLVHINSVQQLGNGDLLVSARHLDALLRIRNPLVAGGGAIVQRIGGVRSDVVFPGQPNPPIAAAHDANLTDAGVLTMFDDRSPAPRRPLANPVGRAIRYQLSGNVAQQTAALPVPGGQISFGLGSARWQPEGTVVVDWGGIQVPAWGEYTNSGVALLEVSVLGGRLGYRVVKEPATSFDRNQLRATAGLG